MSRNIIVFGVSGVGKTTTCRSYVTRNPNWLFTSASTLLKIALGVSSESLRESSSCNIEENQYLLGKALSSFRGDRRMVPIIIDAHAIIDNDHELVRVPTSAIRQLDPDLLILLQASPTQVLEHRTNDKRARPLRTIGQIEQEIQAEEETVRIYAKELDVRLIIGRMDKNFKIDDIIDILL